MKVKATRHDNCWPDGAGDYRIDIGGKELWIFGDMFGDQAEQVAERVIAAINGEALDALPQTERVGVWKLRGRRLPDGRVIVRAFQKYDGRRWAVDTNGSVARIHPDDDGMVEVLTEDAVLVEAKPPAPVMVTVPARVLVDRLGCRGNKRMAILASVRPLLDAAWAAIDEAES